MTTIKIFLASSEELKYERLVIAGLVTKLNYIWSEYDITLRLVKWEYLDSSMGVQHKQDDYNDYLRECDMCVVLFWTKFGRYTEIELKTAYDLLVSDSNLNNMSVIFKEEGAMTESLKCFREKYESEHPELCSSFINESQLRELFIQKTTKCVQKKLEGKHDFLARNVRKLKMLLSFTKEEEPEYDEYLSDLNKAEDALLTNEDIIDKLGSSIQNI